MEHSATWQAIPGANASVQRRWRFPRPHLGSLQARLIVSHGFVLVLALLLVLGISAAGLRRYEHQAEVERLSDLAVPLAVEAGSLMHQGTAASRATTKALLKAQAREMGTRILVFNPKGQVIYDTNDAPNLQGQTLEAYANSIAAVHAEAQRGGGVHRAEAKRTGSGPDPLAGQMMVVASGSKSLHSTPQVVFGLVSPQQGVPLLRRFLPRLLIAAGAALVVALLAGYILSLRIAAPIRRLTRAADAMAAGDLEQRVPGAERDGDEIGRLVASFNVMSARVAAITRSQRDLLANIAHELRTPLTSVQGYTQALRDRVITEPRAQDEALATIGGEAERMGWLIGQLLDLARLEAGQTSLAAEPVAVPELLVTVQRRFAPEAARRNVALHVEAPADLLVRGDEERLEQVLGNLTSNALRFTPAGGEITLSATPVAQANHRVSGVRLTVRDSGSGIAPERLPHIFDRFERGGGEGQSDYAGFGLGLAIVQELVHAHGGEIAVASRLGQGTTFTIDLPMDTLPAATSPVTVPATATG